MATTEHLAGYKKIVPLGLAKRWEEFGEAAKASWKEVHKLGLKGGEAFEKFWDLMQTKAAAGAHLMSVAEAKKYDVAAHPICVLAKEAAGKPRIEAERECIAEGKYHGISLLHAEIEKAKEEGKLPTSESEVEAYSKLGKELVEAGYP